MGIIGYFANHMNAALILAIVVVLEVVKQSLRHYASIVPPSWVWKIGVIVAAVIAGLLTDEVTLSTVFYYAAGSSLIYQTAKMTVQPMISRFIRGEEE